MSTPALQEILIGGFAFVVESGLSVDGGTIGPTIKPDMVPATNWTDGSIGSILDFKFGTVEVDASYSRPSPAGGREQINRKFVTQDFVDIEAREMNELVWRLQHGFTSKIVEGTAQTPGLQVDRKIDCWLRLQGRVLGGLDRFIQDWWAECRLIQGTVADGKVSQPKLRFTQYKTAGGILVAGNSTNFPVN